eukprot:CAMPEP_0116140306 /NCGR_PEP_ID=MMETSP0329-20121206/13772_1 /TAXON_ID=697910 /ORGANISM="Pseudo-nitzschia arenysensis, Strain B593" /LENGTH=550 /DNA_ID=CAMNT_0003635401 /DNA_START=351 /DNA_END=2003 /DNA_ORIENTATION=-
MSLPNDDDENGPRRNPFGHQDGPTISPVKKLTVASSEGDDRTSDETSVGSMSFSSDITSVVAGTNAIPATPLRPTTTNAIAETPMSALSANTSDDASIQSGVSFNTEDGAAIQLRRERNQMQLRNLGAATGATFALFMYMLVPTALLLSMILFGGVSSAFLYQLGQIMHWEFHRSILEGRGIGDYLPESVYRALTSTSIHEFLTDPDGIFGANEHIAYLMLYMIPGLTDEQLEHYINRLNPAHQRILRSNQGLMGFLLNRNNHRLSPNEANQDSTILRFLMGDERLGQWRQQQAIPPPQHPSGVAPRRLDLPPTIPEEEASATRENSTSENTLEPTGIPETVAAVVGSTPVPNPPAESASAAPPSTSNTTPPSPDRRPSATGEIVLFDAMTTAMASLVSEATSAVRERATETVRDAVATPVFRMSLGVTALGLGVGALGLANGTYDLQSFSRPLAQFFSNFMGSLFGRGSGASSAPRSGSPGIRLSFTMPSGGVLLGSTIASGTTAVVLGLFGTTTSRPSSSPSSSTSDSGGDTPKKANTTTAGADNMKR